MKKFRIGVILFFLFSMHGLVMAQPQWLTLPETPTLPTAQKSGYALINGLRIWYAVFGEGEPVILLHGGLGNSNYWGHQIPELAKQYRVIVMDTRGHGRSAINHEAYHYHAMASDVLGLMDFLKIQKAAIVGWSDGGIVGLDIAIHHPERLTKLFAFGANSDPAGTKPDAGESPVFKAYVERTEKEYKMLSLTPKNYKDFAEKIQTMWATEPHFTDAELASITVPTWIVDGDYEEGIKRENTEFMASHIPNAGLLIQPWTSHFGFLQDPKQFTEDLLRFLEKRS